MAVLIVLAGLFVGAAVDHWIPFAIAVVIAAGLDYAKDAWLHDHMHKLYEGEEDEHGVKTID
jgi:hypothetical protein